MHFSDAPASLALMIVTGWLTDWLTDLPKLQIGNFSHLTVLPTRLSVSLVSLEGLISVVIPVSHISLVSPASLVTLCMILQFAWFALCIIFSFIKRIFGRIFSLVYFMVTSSVVDQWSMTMLQPRLGSVNTKILTNMTNPLIILLFWKSRWEI